MFTSYGKKVVISSELVVNGISSLLDVVKSFHADDQFKFLESIKLPVKKTKQILMQRLLFLDVLISLYEGRDCYNVNKVKLASFLMDQHFRVQLCQLILCQI